MIHPMYESIYRCVSRIPKGRVATYGQIARLAGIPGHARLVGYALHSLPQASSVPWHRVVNSRGQISLGSPFGAEEQRQRLRAEGVPFFEGSISLVDRQWVPDDPE